MTDNQHTESNTQRLLRIGTVTLTMLGPVINPLAAQLADRLERAGKQKNAVVVEVEDKPEEILATKQAVSNTLLERRDALVQELEDLVERGTKLSYSLMARSSDATHELAVLGSNASQDLLKRSNEVRQELRKRGKKLNKDLNRRSQKVAKELSRRSEKVTKELSKRGRQAARQLPERSGTFWIVSGFVVGLAAASMTAYLLIRQRVRQQQQLEADQSFPVSQNGYLNINTASTQVKSSAHTPAVPGVQPAIQPVEENVPAVAVADQEQRTPAAQSIPANVAFIGVVGTRRYYPASTPPDQLPTSEDGENTVIYFTTEEEARAQGYSSGL